MNAYLYISTIFIIMVSGMGLIAFLPYTQNVNYRLVAICLLVGTSFGIINSLLCIVLRRRTY